MADTEIFWQGKSGKQYRYWIHRVATYFNDDPGNYIYAMEVEPDSWVALYIGQTHSLQQQLAGTETEAELRRQGATHVHVHTTPGGEPLRAAEVADLIARWEPAGNE